jgi:NADH:ubiquinone oxidoreductase subunit 6 (subunit J)|tara:strand:- start:2469 stop:2738 length:270 start_codon:yes stop_codon:yes gene_type:complete
MKMVSTLVRIGILVVGILIFSNITNSSNWGTSSSDSLDNISFATNMLVDWGFVVILIGVLLSMAMVGAAYLVRDERKENLVWNGGESND